MRKITLPTVSDCPMKDSSDVFLTGDLSSFLDLASCVDKNFSTRRDCNERNEWTGKMSYDTSLRYGREGDMSCVAPSDKWLSQFETLAPMRGAWQTVLDVTGSVPNIPATLTGHPLNMRRRVRVSNEQAPLTVCVDLVSSGGVDAKKLVKRGALILALVRALSATRPVELWCGGSTFPHGKDNANYHIWWRMDTAPLDLARAAHIMTQPSVSRGLLYATLSAEAKVDGGTLSWPYRNHQWSRANMRPVLSRVIGSDDMLCIAAPHLQDRLVDQPEAWFADMLKTYGGIDHDS